jgi:hypothetical protein
MNEAAPKISDLIENARQHLDDLCDHLGGAIDLGDVMPIKIIIESLQGDLSAIERALSDVRIDLQSHVERI